MSPAAIEEKIRKIGKAIEANPNDPFAWHALGVRCYEKRLHLEASECFEKAESIKKNFSASNRFYLALSQRELGQVAESLQSLKVAVTMNAVNTVDKKAKERAQRMLDTFEGKITPPVSRLEGKRRTENEPRSTRSQSIAEVRGWTTFEGGASLTTTNASALYQPRRLSTDPRKIQLERSN